MIAATWVVLSAVAGVDEMVSMRAMERAFFADEARRSVAQSQPVRGWKLKRAIGRGAHWPVQALSSHSSGTPPALDIPWTTNPRVEAYIRFFTGRGRRTFQHWLDRSAVFIPKLRPILEEVGAPRDLVYLAMIESGFRARARSRAGAQGVWQFIPATARSFGLKTGHFVD